MQNGDRIHEKERGKERVPVFRVWTITGLQFPDPSPAISNDCSSLSPIGLESENFVYLRHSTTSSSIHPSTLSVYFELNLHSSWPFPPVSSGQAPIRLSESRGYACANATDYNLDKITRRRDGNSGHKWGMQRPRLYACTYRILEAGSTELQLQKLKQHPGSLISI